MEFGSNPFWKVGWNDGFGLGLLWEEEEEEAMEEALRVVMKKGGKESGKKGMK